MHPAHSAMVNEMESRFGRPRDRDGLILMRLNQMVFRVGKNGQALSFRDPTRRALHFYTISHVYSLRGAFAELGRNLFA